MIKLVKRIRILLLIFFITFSGVLVIIPKVAASGNYKGQQTQMAEKIISNDDVFVGIPELKGITQIKNATPKRADLLGLPNSVKIDTFRGDKYADVIWDMKDVNYDPNKKEEQFFSVTGTVQLPVNVINIYNKSLKTSIDVTVLGAGFKFSFMSISDLHITKDSTTESQTYQKNNFIKALKDAELFKCSAISIVGDITHTGDEKEYSNFQKILKENTRIPSYYIMGNHDVRWKDSFQTAVERFSIGTGIPISYDKPYYDKWIKGYHFIYLCTESDNQDIAYISDKQLDWLNEKLKEKASLDKPIFIFFHQPIGQTLPQEYVNDVSGSDVVQDRKILEILGRFPQSILISGHIHNELRSDATFYNSKFCTMLRDGSVGPGAENDGKNPEGLIINIYKNSVVVNGRDFGKSSTIWRTTINNFTKTNQANDKRPPSAPSDLTITHKTESIIVLKWEDSKDDFTSTNNNVGIAGYDIYDNNICVGSTNGSNSYTVTGLKPNTKHVFTIKAKDVKGNVSESGKPLIAKTLYSNDAPINLALNKKITASTSEKGCGPKKAVDGDDTTRWTSTNAKDIEWIKVDLGAVYDISRWVVKNSNGQEIALSENPKSYRLMGSIDGKGWFYLDGVYENVSTVTDRYFDRASVRYLKVYYDEPCNYKKSASSKETAKLYELEIYGANILKGYSNPFEIKELPSRSAKTDKDLNLPQKLPIKTSAGEFEADVKWNVKDACYNAGLSSAQTFTVSGTIKLPLGVINPDGIPLKTKVQVTVSKEKLSKVTLYQNENKIVIGKPLQISVKGTLKNGKIACLSPATMQYKSSNTKVASIDRNGMIIAKEAGSTTINVIVTVNGEKVKSNYIKIHVPSNDAKLKYITINGKKIIGYDQKITKYNIWVPQKKNINYEIKAKPSSNKAKIKINSPPNSDTATINVMAEDGITTRSYKVNFIKAKLCGVLLQAEQGPNTLQKGKTLQLIAYALDSKNNRMSMLDAKLSYLVSDSKIVSVDEKGRLKAKARGITKVSIKVKLNGSIYKSNALKISVS